MPISVKGRENHSNKWRYRTRFWATGRLNSKFLRVTRGHKGSTWPQLTPHWPYGVNIRYHINVMWYDLEYVIWLIFRSETECDLYFALKISQHTFLVNISRSWENHRSRKYWVMARFPLCNAKLLSQNLSNKRWTNERNWVRHLRVTSM